MTAQLDPARHLLTRLRYAWDDTGSSVSAPIPLGKAAARKRADLEREGSSGAAALSGSQVRVSQLRALVIASLLEEFAARLDRDVTAGAVAPEGAELGAIAAALAGELYAATGLGG